MAINYDPSNFDDFLLRRGMGRTDYNSMPLPEQQDILREFDLGNRVGQNLQRQTSVNQPAAPVPPATANNIAEAMAEIRKGTFNGMRIDPNAAPTPLPTRSRGSKRKGGTQQPVLTGEDRMNAIPAGYDDTIYAPATDRISFKNSNGQTTSIPMPDRYENPRSKFTHDALVSSDVDFENDPEATIEWAKEHGDTVGRNIDKRDVQNALTAASLPGAMYSMFGIPSLSSLASFGRGVQGLYNAVAPKIAQAFARAVATTGGRAASSGAIGNQAAGAGTRLLTGGAQRALPYTPKNGLSIPVSTGATPPPYLNVAVQPKPLMEPPVLPEIW